MILFAWIPNYHFLLEQCNNSSPEGMPLLLRLIALSLLCRKNSMHVYLSENCDDVQTKNASEGSKQLFFHRTYTAIYSPHSSMRKGKLGGML